MLLACAFLNGWRAFAWYCTASILARPHCHHENEAIRVAEASFVSSRRASIAVAGNEAIPNAVVHPGLVIYAETLPLAHNGCRAMCSGPCAWHASRLSMPLPHALPICRCVTAMICRDWHAQNACTATGRLPWGSSSPCSCGRGSMAVQFVVHCCAVTG